MTAAQNGGDKANTELDFESVAEAVIEGDESAPQSFDSQEKVLAIATGEEPAPQVNIAADYEAAQEFMTSHIDPEEAEAAIAPNLPVPTIEEQPLVTEPTGDPEAFLDMAKSVSPVATSGTTDMDSLVEKALSMSDASAQD